MTFWYFITSYKYSIRNFQKRFYQTVILTRKNYIFVCCVSLFLKYNVQVNLAPFIPFHLAPFYTFRIYKLAHCIAAIANNKLRHRSACVLAQSDQHLCCSLSGTDNGYTCYIQNFSIVALFYSWADLFPPLD